MTKQLALALVLLSLSLACNRGPQPIAKGEPAGEAVELTDGDLDQVTFAAQDAKTWAAWHFKGIYFLTRASDVPERERQMKAIYCFHQALKAWPSKLPDDATEMRRNLHHAEPTDTLLQLGWLYLKLNEPKFALAYFKRAETFMPGAPLVTKGVADAEAMLKK